MKSSALILTCICLAKKGNADNFDILIDTKENSIHRLDSLNILIYCSLLALTVLTIWIFKFRRVSWLNETGLAVIYGLIVGAIIRFCGKVTPTTHLNVEAEKSARYNQSLPPDNLFIHFPGILNVSGVTKDQVYAYKFHGQLIRNTNEIDLKATFDPEIFFNIILPSIIFYAGYSLKRKYFFRNLGTILTFAIVGTTLSSLLIGLLMYGFVQLRPNHSSFTFLDTLYFGALISPTDPLTILAIFNEKNVDVNLYALVFGESVLNDAVAIGLSGAIQNYAEHYSKTGDFETHAFLHALKDLCIIFFLSLNIGTFMGCATSLMTKFTRVREFPLLETCLFVLMSYSTFLIAEVFELTGVVAVLFCGICQAHYTYNNLSEESRVRTKQLFELLNFIAENFTFCYIGVSMFSFEKHHFDAIFIIGGFICAAIGRAVNVYPLSWLLNLGRKPKLPWNFQHMLFFAGLRGAMSFALAIRNTVSRERQTMLTSTSLIVITTVIFQGGAANYMLNWLKIPTGGEDKPEQSTYQSIRTDVENPDQCNITHQSTSAGIKKNDKAFLARVWGNFDSRYMKPLLTNSRPTLIETLPKCLTPLSRILTTTQQLSQSNTTRRIDSDSDLCIDDSSQEIRRNSINRACASHFAEILNSTQQ
ncbi:sodium/hydrogen exchanger 7 isoform X2 [Chironomus tepperi]|uniref:sodium/hydrogen exchanger 7 isoform X2 n=1 Tax=Chironomus tepperi TaxID=113505 RepID=UPI00391F87EC